MDNTTPSPPQFRWYRRRKPQLLLVLVAGCVIAFFAWDALFMPADLRRMQGTWGIIKVTDKADQVNWERSQDRIVISGRRVFMLEPDGTPINPVDGRYHWLDLHRGKIFIHISTRGERTICGFQVNLPAWCRPSEGYLYGVYEFTADTLIVRLDGSTDIANNKTDDWGEDCAKVHLVRK